MEFYKYNTDKKIYIYNKSNYLNWCKKEVVKHIYTPFIPLIKKAILDESLNNSFTIGKSPFEIGNKMNIFNESFFMDYAFSFEDVTRHYKKYGKPYTLTNEAYDTFRYEPRTTLISLSGVLDDSSFIPYLREIALYDKEKYFREKAIFSLFDIGNPEAIYEGFNALFGGGINNFATQSHITSKIEELSDFRFSSKNENLIPIFRKFFCQLCFVTGLKENGKRGSVGDDELRLVRHIFFMAIKIGTKNSIDFIIEFGINSPFVDIQTIAYTALMYTPKKLSNISLVVSLIKESNQYSTRRFSLHNLNKGNGRLFADGMIGALVTMKW